MQKVLKFTKICGSYNNFRSGVFLLPHPVVLLAVSQSVSQSVAVCPLD